MRVGELSPHLVRGAVALAGLALGALASVAADRLPARYGITLLVQGRPRSLRRAALIVLGGACGAGVGQLAISAGAMPVESALFHVAVHLAIAVALLAAAAVDLEHMILPSEVTLGGAALAFASSPFRGIGMVGALVGGAVGLALTYLPHLLYARLRGRAGMGLGDVKLALLAGLWLGTEGVLFVVFGSALQAALAAGIMRVFGLNFGVPASVEAELTELRRRAADGDAAARADLAADPMAEPDAAGGRAYGTMRLPFGPFMVLACLEVLFFRRPILQLLHGLLRP